MAEVVRRTTTGDDEFSIHLADFLSEFYADDTVEGQRSRIEEEPRRTKIDREDAYVGAIAEHLSRRWLLGPAPKWSDASFRFLCQAWFTAGDSYRPIYLKESPSAFRRRMIFTEAEPLRRATMPRDGRWWFYEGRRTGRVACEDEVVRASEWRQTSGLS